MQPFRPEPYKSHRESRARDALLDACAKKIRKDNIPSEKLYYSGRPLSAAVRARILRGEYQDVSLSRAFQLADSAGVDDMTVFRSIMPHVPA